MTLSLSLSLSLSPSLPPSLPPSHPPSASLSLHLYLPTDAKLDAVELLLHSFGSAATFLNPQATRCACLYSLDFDPSGTVIGAAVRVSKYAKLTTYSLPYK